MEKSEDEKPESSTRTPYSEKKKICKREAQNTEQAEEISETRDKENSEEINHQVPFKRILTATLNLCKIVKSTTLHGSIFQISTLLGIKDRWN